MLASDSSAAPGLNWVSVGAVLTSADITNAAGYGGPNQLLGMNPGGTALEFKTLAGANNLGVAQEAGSILLTSPWVQSALGEFSTYAGTSSQIPADDTIPQSNEGYQTATVSITPRNATNYLYFFYSGIVYSSASITATVALFRNAEAGAIAVSGETVYGTHMRQVTLTARVPCQNTDPQTFKIRVGLGLPGTMYLNGTAGGRIYGGLAAHKLTVFEAQ